MKIKILSTKHLDYSSIVGKRVILNTNDKNINASVIFIDKRHIHLALPYAETFIKGDFVKIETLYLNNILALYGKVKKCKDNSLVIRLLREAESIQNRDYLRVKCNIPCEIEGISTGKIENLSASGAFVRLDKEHEFDVENNSVYTIRFDLNGQHINETFNLVEGEHKTIRLKFNNLEPEVLECLINYCFERDALIFRGAKHDR